ncbi:MAG: hypothetical protein PHD67_07055 [Oscillospiraceae bacterium]|nr:hypothetical protein [Oscillospiraceae bacterium]
MDFYRQLWADNRSGILRGLCLCMALSLLLTAAICGVPARAEGMSDGAPVGETVGETMLQNASEQLLGNFSAEISVSSSPLIAMAAMSVVGAAQNGSLPAQQLLAWAPRAQELFTQGAQASRRLIDLSGLPIATFSAVVTLLSILALWALINLSVAIGELCCPPLLAVSRPIENYFSNRLGNLAGYTLVVLFIVINLVDFFLEAPAVAVAAAPSAGPVPLLMGLERPLAVIVVFCVSFLAMVLGTSVYTVIKTVRRFLQILTLPIPLGNFLFALIKGAVAAVMVWFSQVDPLTGVLVGAGVLALCLILYKKAYQTIRYYDTLYVKTAWHSVQRFFKKEKTQPPVCRRLPKQLRETLGEVQLAVPAFALFRFYSISKKMRCFLVLKDGRLYLWGKDWLRQPVCVDILESCGGQGVFLKKEWGRYRLQWNNEGANKANLGGFALSLDCKPYTGWLFDLGVVDYDTVMRQLKQAGKELRGEARSRRRQERYEARQEKRRLKQRQKGSTHITPGR